MNPKKNKKIRNRNWWLTSKVGKENDRRIKFTEEKKNQCELMYLQGIAIKEISREIQISVRAIQFFLFPERLEACKERRKERGGSKIYYDTEKQKESMKEHRTYMKKLNEEGKI